MKTMPCAAVHAGLGIVEAITTTLNPRLEREKGVQLAVRIGLHTGPVVVGEMGGGGRHEHLATGDTVQHCRAPGRAGGAQHGGDQPCDGAPGAAGVWAGRPRTACPQRRH